MPQQAMQVDPVSNDRGDIVDFQVHTGHANAIGRDGQVLGWENDYVQDSKGEFRHVMQDVELNEDTSGSFNFDEYVNDLHTVDPSIQPMLAWAAQTDFVSNEVKQQLNAAIDAQDLAGIHSALGSIRSTWEASGEETQVSEEEITEEEDVTVEDWYENISDEDLDESLNDLYDTDFATQDPGVYTQAMDSFEQGSIEHDMLLMGYQLTQGNIDVDTAMDQIIGHYGEAEAARAYYILTQHLN